MGFLIARFGENVPLGRCAHPVARVRYGSDRAQITNIPPPRLFGGDQKRFILVHAKTVKGQGVPPGISCVDLPQRSGNISFEALPASGGMPPVMLLVIPLALILAGTAGLLALWRRIA